MNSKKFWHIFFPKKQNFYYTQLNIGRTKKKKKNGLNKIYCSKNNIIILQTNQNLTR